MTSRYLDGPALLLDGPTCAQLDQLLLRALVDARLRDATVPPSLRDLAADVHAVALKFRSSALVGPCAATPEPVLDAELPVWNQEERLSTAKAARLTGVSDSYMRRVIARGDVPGRRTLGGGWEVEATVLALWSAERQQRREGRGHGQQAGRGPVLRNH